MPANASATLESDFPTITERPYFERSKRRERGPLHILLVEDDASDAMLAEIDLEASHIEHDLFVLNNGRDVLAYLQRQGRYRDEHKTDIVLLDLSLPDKDGFEVLADMAMEPERFGDIPIAILTGDEHSGFLKYSHDLNIVAYITKPCSVDKLRKALAGYRLRR